VVVDPVAPSGSEREGSLAFIRTTLRERLLPSLSEPYQMAQAKAALRTTRHLQQGERYNAPIDEQERTELSALLRGDVTSAAEGRRMLADALDAGTVGDAAALSYLGRHVQRETIRMSELLGPMATTPLPQF
jgi:hypothetical protein